MPRKSSASANNTTTSSARPRIGPGSRFVSALTTIAAWGFWVTLLIGAVWGAITVEQFVINDKRFALVGPPEPGIESDHFQIIGATHSSEQQIANVFQRDFGRSVYLCPIAERRRRLLAIDWVQDATVSRVWPNRIIVRIKERVPVAFVQLPGEDNTMVYGLVDNDGLMLDPRRATKLALPVITGIRSRESEITRREKVHRFLRLQKELGPEMEKVSEIDVSEPDNIKVVQVVEGRGVTLLLGNKEFLPRFQSFQENYAEIQRRLGKASVIDLRLKDRFTAVVTEESQ